MASLEPAEKIRDLLNCRAQGQEPRARDEVGAPYEIGQWVSEHKDEARSVICETQEFRDMRFCETGDDRSLS
jgi:hypothetical protein